ncbi:Alanine racemase 1 [Phycisphaerae bacterium RAS2]|nr:Alanine racemase 1 [Phycisphaerae bacterium RAS2]
MRSDLIAQVNPDALRHNYRALRAAAGAAKFCAPLKADAYGHGVRIVAPVLHEAGADMAAVATVPEAVELRATGWTRPILVLGSVLATVDAAERNERLTAIVQHGLTITVADEAAVRVVEERGGAVGNVGSVTRPTGGAAARASNGRIDAHIKFDTGMGRMGVMPDGLLPLIQRVRACSSLRLAGIYSHFAMADFDPSQRDLVQHQQAVFAESLARAGDFLPPGVIRHLANSAATITLPEAHYDMVRPGLALYGYWPALHMRERIDLRPCLRLVSHLTAVKDLPVGHCVGYGRTFVTKRPTKLGIVPMGYFDGFLRALSNRAVVTVCGAAAPVVGRVSMDQMAVDLTDVIGAAGPINSGCDVTIISDDPAAPNSVQAIATRLGTIPYEVTCLLGQRVERASPHHS